MQVPGGDNAGPGSDILWPKLMSEGKETLLETMKANSTLFEFNFILSEIFIPEWTLSLMKCAWLWYLATLVNINIISGQDRMEAKVSTPIKHLNWIVFVVILGWSQKKQPTNLLSKTIRVQRNIAHFLEKWLFMVKIDFVKSEHIL